MNHEIKLIHGLMRDALESSFDPITLDWTSAKAVVAALDQRAELLTTLKEVRDNVIEDSPEMWGRVRAIIEKCEAP